jgi:hypothetical protein
MEISSLLLLLLPIPHRIERYKQEIDSKPEEETCKDWKK